jgi:biopolymer transport protein ExbD
MIPMIDLLMVTISFLLITAVWTHMSRLNANAMVPGSPPEGAPSPKPPEKQLHVMMQSESFVLVWKEGSTVVDSIAVPRVATGAGPNDLERFPDLAARIESEWKAKGQHTRADDPGLDEAVLHTDNHTEFKDIVAVMDAIYATKRTRILGAKSQTVSAFNMTFSTSS